MGIAIPRESHPRVPDNGGSGTDHRAAEHPKQTLTERRTQMPWAEMWADQYGVGISCLGFALTASLGGIVVWTPWRAFGVGHDGFWTRAIPDLE